MSAALFPTNFPAREWAEFAAEGFSHPVCGVIHRGSNPPECGMPLGGLDTGCLDLEATGLLGYSTIFNTLIPRRGPLNLPFLGVSVGSEGVSPQTWVCTTQPLHERQDTTFTWLSVTEMGRYKGVRTASEIHYWGHYPVADLEFDLPGCPLSVGLRSWTPFIPGDVAASNTPGAVFEVHLRNQSAKPQKGSVALSFPGPSEGEAGAASFARRPLQDGLQGVAVCAEKASYALGVIGEPARVGGFLGEEGSAWAVIDWKLPYAVQQGGASLAVDFNLAAGEARVLRFVLAWHSPVWSGGGSNQAPGNPYTHMYERRYPDVEPVARFLAQNHASLLQRILAWQSVLYSEESLPPWLRESLINVLHLITETSVWGQAKPPIGEWCRPEDGVFGMNESPRWCPQIECIPCSFYGNLPLVYFFPEAALSTLRAYKAYQFPDGQMPWVFGGVTVRTSPYELALPSRGYAVKPQTTLDGGCYAEMVDKLWQREAARGGGAALAAEFYESVKKNAIFTMNLRPGSGAAGIVSMPAENNAYDWYELCDLFGVVPHIGGVHLAQLRLAQRMAEAVGDADFARQCQEWLDQGSAVLEEAGWDGSQYLLFNEQESGKRSNVILAHQLDGEWIARFHGLQGVFRPDRVATVLETLKRTSLARSEFGAAVFGPPEDGAPTDWDPGYWTLRGVHPPGTFMLAMTYMYNGQGDLGLDLARRTIQEVIRRGWMWDWPVLLDGSEGPRIGTDYYQNLMLWSLPAAVSNQNLAGPCAPGGLVARLLQAGQASRTTS